MPEISIRVARSQAASTDLAIRIAVERYFQRSASWATEYIERKQDEGSLVIDGNAEPLPPDAVEYEILLDVEAKEIEQVRSAMAKTVQSLTPAIRKFVFGDVDPATVSADHLDDYAWAIDLARSMYDDDRAAFLKAHGRISDPVKLARLLEAFLRDPDEAPEGADQTGQEVFEGVSPERVDKIFDWLNAHANARDPMTGSAAGGRNLALALKGSSPLGPLTKEEKRAITKATADHWVGVADAADLLPEEERKEVEAQLLEQARAAADLVQTHIHDDPELEKILAEAYRRDPAARGYSLQPGSTAERLYNRMLGHANELDGTSGETGGEQPPDPPSETDLETLERERTNARLHLNGIVLPAELYDVEKTAYETRRTDLNTKLAAAATLADLDAVLAQIDAFAADVRATRREIEDAADPHAPIGPEPADPPSFDDKVALLKARLAAIKVHDSADEDTKSVFQNEKTAIASLLSTVETDYELLKLSERITQLANKSLWTIPLKERLGLDDAAAEKLDTWVGAKPMDGGERLTGEALAKALKGQSSLGTLTDAEKRYLATQAAASWLPSPEVPIEDDSFHEERLGDIRALTRAVKDDPEMSKIVADAMLEQYPGEWEFMVGENLGHVARVRDLAAKMDFAAAELDPEGYAARFPGAEEGLQLARRVSGANYYPGPEDGVKVVEEVMIDGQLILNESGPGPMPDAARNAMLMTAADGKMDPAAANSFVSTMYAWTTEDDAKDHKYRRALSQAMAKVLGDAQGAPPGDRRKTEARLARAMGTDGGRQALFNKKVSPALRNWALTQIAPDPSNPAAKPIDPAKLEGGWESKELSQAYARKQIEEAKKAFAQPVTVSLVSAEDRGVRHPDVPSGIALNTVGQALGLKPTRSPENETPEERQRRLDAGLDHPYYDHTKQPFKNLKEKWKEDNPLGGVQELKVQPIPVSVTSNEFGASVFKVLRMYSGGKFSYFTDQGGRIYKNVPDWRKNNILPPGQMTYPAGLELNGKLITEQTPAAKPGAKIVGVLDDAAVVAGMAAGIAAIAGTGGLATPAVAAAVAAYTTGRAIGKASDRADHGFDISDMSDADNRALMYDIASGPLSIAGVGAGMRAASLAAKGAQMGRTASTMLAGLQVADNILGGVQTADQVIQLRKNWHKLTPEQKDEAMMQLGMQAAMSAAGMAKKKADGGFILDDYSLTRTRNVLEHGSPYNLRKALPEDDIPEGGCAVRYEPPPPQEPKKFEIVYNSDSRPSRFMLELHGRAAANMEMSVGLEGRFRAFLKGTKYGDPEHAPDPKTAPVAWEAMHECQKIRLESFRIAKRLQNPDMPDHEQEQIRDRLAELAYALQLEQARLKKFDELFPKGYVAAPGDGNALAKQRGYPDFPEPGQSGKPEYKWVVDPNSPNGLQPKPIHPDVPGLKFTAKPKPGKFTYLVNRGWRDEDAPAGHRQQRNWYANNPEPNSTYEYDDGSVYNTDSQGRTKSVKMSFPTPPAKKAVKWDRDESVQTDIGHVGKDGDPSESYDGGHLIPRELGGAPGKLNVIPMQSELNQRGEWRQLETSWYADHHAGHKVDIQIDVVYHGSGNEARRQTPKYFKVVTTVAKRKKGPDGKYLRDSKGNFIYGKPEKTPLIIYNTADGKK